MPEESTTPDLLELGRRVFDAGRRADLDGLMGFYRSDIVLEASTVGLTFEGLTEIRRFYVDFFGLWEDLVSELEELLDLGNGVTFSVISNRGRPVGSSAEAQQRVAWVAMWEESKIARVDIYIDVDEGRAAAERLAQERG
jgi:ketosteroid isomerase-like protein